MDRLLAVASPQALAQVKGQAAPAQNTISEFYTDDVGQAWVILQGKQVKYEDYQKLMNDAGVRLGNGQVVPETEVRRAFEKLDDMVGGGR